MAREHGSNVCYVFGVTGRTTRDGCRCQPCKTAQARYNRDLRARTVPAYVSATRARTHVAELQASGVGLKQIARVSGVPNGALSKLMHGTTTRGPSKRVRPTTAERILAVSPSMAADGARVDGAATWVLIDEMVACGVPRSRVAEALGNKGAGLQLRRGTILAGSARVVAGVHAEWVSGRGPLVRRTRWGDVAVPPPPRVPMRVPVSRFAAVDDLVTSFAEVVELRNSRGWRSAAACRDLPVWMWFPARGDTQTAGKAVAVCRVCPVADRCLSENLDEVDGIYGAVSARQRVVLRTRRDLSAA